jgi:hypothetical protein
MRYDCGLDSVIGEKLEQMHVSSLRVLQNVKRRGEESEYLKRKRQKRQVFPMKQEHASVPSLDSMRDKMLERGVHCVDETIVDCVLSTLQKMNDVEWKRACETYLQSRYYTPFSFDDVLLPTPTRIEKVPKQDPEELLKLCRSQWTHTPHFDALSLFGRILKQCVTYPQLGSLCISICMHFEGLEDVFVEWLVEDFVERWEVAVTWMVSLFARKERKVYMTCFEKVWLSVDVSQTQAFLLACPVVYIPYSREKWSEGIDVLGVIGKERKEWRPVCVQGMLHLSTDSGIFYLKKRVIFKDRAVRMSAILVLKEYYTKKISRMDIETAASKNFRAVNEGDTLRYAELYLVLCSKNVDLFPLLFTHYAQCTSLGKKELETGVLPLIQSFSEQDLEKVYEMLFECCVGGEGVFLCVLKRKKEVDAVFLEKYKAFVNERGLDTRYMVAVMEYLSGEELMDLFTILCERGEDGSGFSSVVKNEQDIKEDVKDVREGYECGIAFENYDDIKVGDLVEVFEIVEEQKQL